MISPMVFGFDYLKNHQLSNLYHMKMLLIMLFAMGGSMDREKKMTKNHFYKSLRLDVKKVFGQKEIFKM